MRWGFTYLMGRNTISYLASALTYQFWFLPGCSILPEGKAQPDLPAHYLGPAAHARMESWSFSVLGRLLGAAT